ncbi:hypothetical protein EKE94_14315 [Mesobaculum littorinae]|uniref:Uncharacterized protein n=1 Tax=Mesobaculum littorinae TaxID=2486419 RepID=A0A438AET6_9RHOB|nr:hypothetical protein [Mesobaculum littorinae]RVV97192.1 hypothetical protein EKE94_14315 [Mesobaculum littorinae]
MLADYAIAGTPDACRQQIEALIARTGCCNLRCLFSANGLIPIAEAEAAMALFAAEVMPAFRDYAVLAVPEFHLEGS